MALLSGALTAPAAQLLEHRLADTLGSEADPVRVILDLNGATAIDRTGLDVILDIQSRIIKAGGEFELLDPSPRVITMLHEAAEAL
ncbi:STAS domain-containing protein [Nakamurella sp. GG22]